MSAEFSADRTAEYLEAYLHRLSELERMEKVIEKRCHEKDLYKNLKEYTRPGFLCLIFFPTIPGGERLIKRLSKEDASEELLDFGQIHGRMTEEDRQSVLARLAKSEKRSILVSTSISETSLTFENLTTVCDFGLSMIELDQPDDNTECLVRCKSPNFIRLQRKGRVGRIKGLKAFYIKVISYRSIASEYPDVYVARSTSLAVHLDKISGSFDDLVVEVPLNSQKRSIEMMVYMDSCNLKLKNSAVAPEWTPLLEAIRKGALGTFLRLSVFLLAQEGYPFKYRPSSETFAEMDSEEEVEFCKKLAEKQAAIRAARDPIMALIECFLMELHSDRTGTECERLAYRLTVICGSRIREEVLKDESGKHSQVLSVIVDYLEVLTEKERTEQEILQDTTCILQNFLELVSYKDTFRVCTLHPSCKVRHL
ncbi:hypothetical protein FOZ63_029400 [Perkinsus olseni]|uniref:Helicase C-terminal domain-containing protein n=1 Tax=Perkinsus olseni TaxID=32597 RepID=A0A7J6UPU2_PEROL|nr:hypothetical protein FOZ62_010078 [Perkinsus olseni]KAF4759340.1 hypothetical protein FOZ63_029400 [Perkinsus olseni]